MRRVVLLAALLVLAWTSVAAAEVRSLAQFWAENTGLQTGVLDDDGNDWVEWPESWKLLWIYGFLAGTYRISVYLQEVPLPVWPEMAQKVPEQVFESMRDALAALALVRLGSDYPFRVGAYKLELDALYRDEANRSIRLTDAMYIANEHLSRRYVDIAKWRKTEGEQAVRGHIRKHRNGYQAIMFVGRDAERMPRQHVEAARRIFREVLGCLE